MQENLVGQKTWAPAKAHQKFRILGNSLQNVPMQDNYDPWTIFSAIKTVISDLSQLDALSTS